jgi:hypothetical protein
LKKRYQNNNKVLNQYVAKNVVIEETIVHFNHTEEITWLLPGVKPTKKSVTVPIVLFFNQVSFVEFNEDGKIVNKRVHWDQATVLRQIGVLPNSLYCRSNSSEVVLPISGAEIATSIESNQTVSLVQDNEMSKPNFGRMESHDLFNLNQETFRPSSRVLSRPGGETHDIFSVEPVHERSNEKRHMHVESTLNLYDDTSVPTVKKDNVRDPNWSNPDRVVENTHERRHAGVNNQSHFELGGDDAIEAYVPARKIDPTQNQSHFSFTQEDAIPARRTGRRDPNARSEPQQSRPSSRLYFINVVS